MKRAILFVFMGMLLVGAGCAKRQVVKPSEEVVTPPAAEEEKKEEPSVRFGDWEKVPQLRAVNFEFDRSELGARDRDILKDNADYLKSNPDLLVIVEGHTDERGTTEYNLALGQRRASTVREYYGTLGVQLGRVATISYGEERPTDPGHTENAWAVNRRAETKVRSAK